MTVGPPVIRQCGYMECLTAHSARSALGASTMIVSARLHGPMTLACFTATARRLYDRHQIMRCRLSEDSPRPSFIEDVRFEDVPLTMTQAADANGVRSAAEQLLHDPLTDVHHLWQALLVEQVDAGRWHVIFKVHHAMADGRSLGHLVDQFIATAARVHAGEPESCARIPLPAAAEQRVATPTCRADVFAANETQDNANRTPFKLDHAASIPLRRTRLTAIELDKAATTTLVQAARAAGTTVLGAIAAAYGVAVADTTNAPCSLEIQVPWDMRGLFDTPAPVDEIHMGAFAVAVAITDVSSCSNPWQVARDFRAAAVSAIGPGCTPPVDFLDADITDGQAAWSNHDDYFPAGACISNVGVLPFAGDHGPFTLEQVRMTAAMQFGGMPLLIVPVTHKGALCLTVSWIEPLVEGDHAQAIMAAMTRRLEAMTESISPA